MEHQARNPTIHIELDERGVQRVLVYADDCDGQAAAHILLARIQREIFQIDKTLKTTTEVVVVPTEPDVEVKHGHQKIQ